MTVRLRLKTRPLLLVAAPVVLAVFAWGLYQTGTPAADNGAINPSKTRLLQQESSLMRHYGQWEKALAPALKLHNAYPDSHLYIQQLAEIYSHLGRPAEEAALWEQFLVHAPRPIEACPQIGKAYQKAGQTQRAIGAMERCLAFEPKNPDSIFYLAHTLELAGELDRAADLYEQGSALSPDYADMRIGLARLRLRQGKLPEAKTAAEAIVNEAPKDVDALLVLGLACQRMGDRANARRYLERGASLADNDADFHVALGSLAEQDANLDQAIAQYRKAAQLDRGNREVAQKLALLEKARP